MANDDRVVFPDEATTLSKKEIRTLRDKANVEFETLAEAGGEIDEAGLERLDFLANGIAALSARYQNAPDGEAELKEDAEAEAEEKSKVEAEAKAAAKAAGVKKGAVARVAAANQLFKTALSNAQANAPEVVPEPKSQSLVVTAGAPRVGVPTGTQIRDLDGLVDMFQSHAKAAVVTSGVPQQLTVASIRNEFEHVIDGEKTSLGEFDSLVRELRDPDKVEALVAGGGWCAPSEIRYDFFNITCEDGMIDLPTFGVNRGGIQHPVSPSLADVFTGTFTNTTNPWLWTEADDILTVTGSPNKPCVRVICPTFDNRRLECYGICLTAGNLTDSAYPEATRNHLRLLMSAHFHAMNQRLIATMVSLSSAVTSIGITGSGTGIFNDFPAAAALAAQDYRTRFGMCDNDVLEIVAPRWARDAMRVDYLRRTGGGADYDLTDAAIAALFNSFRVRVQWVQDWQIRSAGLPGGSSNLTDWPGTMDFMIYAAGTFLQGNGLTLDLGIVRDSVLNAENDHTAAWSEECHLIAKVGHESRQYRIPVCVAGRTGAASITCADV